MKISVAVAAVLHLAAAGHVDVRMPYLNPAGVTYYQGQQAYSAPAYDFGASAYSQQLAYQQHLAYENQNPYGQAAYDNANHLAYQQQVAYKAPAAVGYAQVPVKAAVAVPTVHHVPAVADVPVTKIEAKHAVIQKIVEVAKPAVKTQKYEIRRPAIQKQFYDIEERTVIRPVGSALLELDEPLSQHQKGPAVVSSLEDPHHKEIAYSADHGVAVASSHAVAVSPVAHAVAITPAPHVVAITPSSHISYSTAAPSHEIYHAQPLEHHHSHDSVIVSSTPAPIHYSTQGAILVTSTPAPHHHSDESIFVEQAARQYEEAKHAAHVAKIAHEEAIARAHYDSEVDVHHDAIARANELARAEARAQEQAIAQANYEAEVQAHRAAVLRANHHAQEEELSRASLQHSNEHLIVEAHSNGAPHKKVVVNNGPVDLKSINHLSHEEAHANQHNLLKLLTARGGVAEVGHERNGPAEYVGDAGISRARVLSATPSPYHEPIDEKIKTRRIVVSRPVQTLQEIEVIQPATKIDKVAVNHPTIIKTAKLGYERVQTSVPVYGKALAPAIAHAQVPVEYYH